MKLHHPDQDVRCFTIVLLTGEATEFVEIHESEMDGWTLYECFFLPSFEICYFGWDEDACAPEWIDLGTDGMSEKESLLGQELVHYKRPAA